MKEFSTDRISQDGALQTLAVNGTWTAGVIGVGSGRSRDEKIKAYKKAREAHRVARKAKTAA